MNNLADDLQRNLQTENCFLFFLLRFLVGLSLKRMSLTIYQILCIDYSQCFIESLQAFLIVFLLFLLSGSSRSFAQLLSSKDFSCHEKLLHLLNLIILIQFAFFR
jgi:hypothetical protein